ncbi:MAG: alpha/beta hydrolase [Pirellula sp.]
MSRIQFGITFLITLQILGSQGASPRAHGQESNAKAQIAVVDPIVISYDVPYGNPDEPMHRADIYRPQSTIAQKLPGVILIHGGAWALGDKSNDSQHAKRLARLGFVVMAINYRLAPKHSFPSQLDDCYLALEWFCNPVNQLDVDMERIGGWGYSAGGHLAALLATKPKSGLPRLKACVVGAAPCDLTLVPENSRLLSGFLGGTRAEFPDRYRNASPVTFVSSDDPPIFLFHGTKDVLVPQESTLAMRRALEKNGVPVEHMVVENKAHLMTFIDKEATEKSFVFLQSRLQKE